MAAAPVETCQSVVLRSPWGRLGSVLYTCNRLHRMRRRIQHFWSISPSSPRSFGMNYLTMASRALGEHQTAASMAYAAQATTRHQTYLERPPGADLPPKKVCNLGPMAPRSRRCWTRYCDETCQHDHWRRGHKQMCKKIHRAGGAPTDPRAPASAVEVVFREFIKDLVGVV